MDNVLLNEAAKYRKQCVYLAKRICGNEEDSEEIFSDALRLLWEKGPSLSPETLKFYLFKTVRNLSLKKNEEKSAQKRSFDALSEEEKEQADFFSLEVNFEVKELAELINGYLLTLSKDARKIFVCRCYYGMSVKETAKHLKISESKVKISLMRTRNGLKELIYREEEI